MCARNIRKNKGEEERGKREEMVFSEENDRAREEKRGGKGKANILSPPGTQLTAPGYCLYIRAVDRAVAERKKIKV